MKGRNCWNVNFTICCRGLLPFLCVCVFFFSLPSLIPSSSVLFHECAAILTVWSHGVSASMALTGWKIQCHMVDGGGCPISFLFRAQSLQVTLFHIPVPRFQLRSHAHLQYTVCQSVLLSWSCPRSLSFLSLRVFGDLFSLFILMQRILITRLQDP